MLRQSASLWIVKHRLHLPGSSYSHEKQHTKHCALFHAPSYKLLGSYESMVVFSNLPNLWILYDSKQTLRTDSSGPKLFRRMSGARKNLASWKILYIQTRMLVQRSSLSAASEPHYNQNSVGRRRRRDAWYLNWQVRNSCEDALKDPAHVRWIRKILRIRVFAPLRRALLRCSPEHILSAATWLILPVVICLSQRLSHACLSISIVQRNCRRLIKTVMVYLMVHCYLDNRSNSRANTCTKGRLTKPCIY